MYRGLWPWEAPSVVFYEVWRPQEVQALTALTGEVGPLNKPNTPGSEDRGWELGEAGSDECIEDCGPGRLHLSYSTRSGGPRRSSVQPSLATGLTNTPGSEDRGWELGEVGSDECIKDCSPGRLHR